MEKKSPSFSMEPIAQLGRAQDGACYKDYFFLFDARGKCTVYHLPTFEKISEFYLDKSDEIRPHSNAVCFGGSYYAEGDEFPLLYTNVYNNYQNQEDKKIGYCLVYRIRREGESFASTLVQILRIGFTQDTTYWYAEDEDRPYGNFIVDSDENKVYAFVMRKDKTTFLKFPLPAYTDGEYDATYGVNLFTFQIADIEERFDCEYFTRIQGATYRNGKIYSLEGMTWTESKLRIIDLKEGKVVSVVNLTENGYDGEPEAIFFHNGNVYIEFYDEGMYRYPANEKLFETFKL